MFGITAYIAFAVGFLILHAIFTAATSPQRAIPGPFLARFTRLWFLVKTYLGHIEQDNIELHRKYGPVVRYGPNEYSFSDPDALKTIYAPGANYPKTGYYDAYASGGVRSLFNITDNTAHSQLRRKHQSTYSMTSLVTYESFADEATRLLCTRLEELADAGPSKKVADMAWWFLCFASDSISMITFSKRFGCLDRGEDQGELLAAMHRNFVYSSLVGIYSWLHPLLSSAFSWLSFWGVTKETGRVTMTKFALDATAERRRIRADGKTVAPPVDDENAPKGFLDKFLDFNENDPDRFRERDMYAGLVSNVVAGTETTAVSLSGILYHLLKNPESLNKLREEIDTAWSNGSLSSPVTFKQSQAMPYLQAVIQEGMRVHSAVGVLLPRQVPPGGAQISGHFFPEGTSVAVNPWVFHYNTEIFGEDAAAFRPERWFTTDKERLSLMQRVHLPFGLGSRTCIGKHISMLEMSKVLPELLRRFDFELSPELQKGHWKTSNYFLVYPDSLETTVKRRKQS